MSAPESPAGPAREPAPPHPPAPLAPYAMHSRDSVGRRYPEAPDPLRSPYEVDRARIIHSAAFRRLSHKTQVFTGERSDYHRTRLTHTLEVAVVARTLGRALRLNDDLIETLALAHDLGHPPFGHAGEDILDCCLADCGGFNHNRQGLRIVEELERVDRRFPGLNLSSEVLAGQAERTPSRTGNLRPLLEVQAVEAADSITYDTHDADDALYLGLLELGELLEIPLWQAAARRVRRQHTDLTTDELRWAVLQELLNWQLTDVIDTTRRGIEAAGIASVAAARQAAPLVIATPELAEQKRELEAFLFERVYKHPQVLEFRAAAQQALAELFAHLVAHPRLLPSRFAVRVDQDGLPRTVGDYVAGMTDRYALAQHRDLVRAGAK